LAKEQLRVISAKKPVIFEKNAPRAGSFEANKKNCPPAFQFFHKQKTAPGQLKI